MSLRGLRTTRPTSRCVIPLIPETGSPALRARTTSRKVTSPSPRTTTSTSAQDARIRLSCTVAWTPPITVSAEEFHAFTRRQASRADRKLSDMAVTPTTAGSRRPSVSSSFPMGSADGPMSRSRTSTDKLSCNRTAARLRSPSGGSSDLPVKTGFTNKTSLTGLFRPSSLSGLFRQHQRYQVSRYGKGRSIGEILSSPSHLSPVTCHSTCPCQTSPCTSRACRV